MNSLHQSSTPAQVSAKPRRWRHISPFPPCPPPPPRRRCCPPCPFQRMNGLHPRTGSQQNLGDGATPDFRETFRCAQKRANSKSPISQMSRQNNPNFWQPAGNRETDKYAKVDMQIYFKPMACLVFQNQKSTRCLTRFWTIEQLKTSNVQRKASIKHQTYKEPVKTSVLVSPSVSRLVKKFLQNDNQTT